MTSGPDHWDLGVWALTAMRDEKAIAHFEAALQEHGHTDTSWVRDLITAGRDSATGQVYLDRHISDLIAATPGGDRDYMQNLTPSWYLAFGFLDRYFEFILDYDPNDSWDSLEADYYLFHGMLSHSRGFTAHPKYLEVAEAMGIIKIWEKRGPPDFCDKVGGQWVCE